jgi:glycosyltransferase involved in cell wall biosynthesis
MTRFSVVLATRNRPALFRNALNSVLAQSRRPDEFIVVDDGSAEADRTLNREIVAGAEGVRLELLPQRRIGHGQSYALNFGVARSSGDYLCFLDDDDVWTDAGYLHRMEALLQSDAEPPELHLSDQEAVLDGQKLPGPIWIEDLGDFLNAEGRRPETSGAFAVTVRDLLRANGFCHLNTLMIRRSLFDRIAGLDEAIRYENDRDFYLRAIDAAASIKYSPRIIARHNAPDRARRDNLSTVVSALEKHRYQLYLLERLVQTADHSEIRAYARRHKAHTLKKIASQLADSKKYDLAFYYALSALPGSLSPKWLAYTLYLGSRNVLG